MKKILFIAAHRPHRSPSQRFRFEQFIPFFYENGYDCEYSFLFSEKDDKLFYCNGKFIKKSFLLFRKFFRRFSDVFRLKKYDLIFIQRESFFIGDAFFEWLFSLSKLPIVYDFDDAIWVKDVSEANKYLRCFKNTSKISKIISLSNLVIAGNKYLSDYAKSYNDNVIVVPTVLNTNIHKPMQKKHSDEIIVIGWSGSLTTIKHFKTLESVLKKIQSKYSNVKFELIGDGNYVNSDLNIIGKPWAYCSEVEDLNEFDIGIMPLPEDKWSSGKCGFKGLSYMSLAIPTIMSPVGVNTEIIQNGVNGYLCSTEEEWVDRLSQLIESKELRQKLGDAGRQTVIKKYSVEAYKNTYIKYFNELTKS